ncbi:uncharacterized protein LOC124289664 [Haliotis rubra]|uniref:uncharacterized protein LOC124289664 n=1 Tax=Haliotis rubra TaxID=36100 RepID=UPI001EE5745B|nr:uncharacterized protein LOC124289664 [Haliotis rubra]
MLQRIIDLQEYFQDWAWRHYLNTRTSFFAKLFRPKLKYKHADIEILWEKFKTTTQETKYVKQLEGLESGTKVVIEAEYDNDTDNDQTHSFKTEQDTESTASITLTKGYSKQANTTIEMDLPDEMSRMTAGDESPDARKKQMATASFGNSIHVGTDENSVVRKKKTWSVDTTIVSKSKKQTIAKMEVEETSAKYKFTSAIKLKGRVVVVIRDRRNMEKVVQVVENNVATVLKDINIRNGGSMNDLIFDSQNRTVELPVHGSVVFRYGVSQKVKVSYGKDAGAAKSQAGATRSVYPSLAVEDIP